MQRPIIPDLDELPTFHEVCVTVFSRTTKQPGLTAFLPKCSSMAATFSNIDSTASSPALGPRAACVPQQWKDANIVTIYKRKGDKAICGNSRGISLLSVAGKVLAGVMLRRLLTVDIVMQESQCGFRRGRSTIDMMFVARLLQEKCREQRQSLFFA